MVNRAIHLMKTPVGGGGGGAVTWDPTPTTGFSAGVILSNSNLTMLAPAVAGGGARSTTSHKTGRFYFECTIDMAGAYGFDIGFADAARAFDPSAYNTGPVVLATNGVHYDVGTDNFSTIAQGDTLGFIVDFSAPALWLVGSGAGTAWSAWSLVNGNYPYSVINPASPSQGLAFGMTTAQDKFIFGLGLGTGVGGTQGGGTLRLTAASFLNPHWLADISPNYGVW